jgi:transposase-like protein
VQTARTKAIFADAGAMYDPRNEAEIRAQAEVFRETWQEREPKAVGNLFTDFAKTFASLRVDFSESLRGLIRTTNRWERFHKEMRRKQRSCTSTLRTIPWPENQVQSPHFTTV